MEDLAGKRVLIVGLGKSGVAAAAFLAKAGSKVIAADVKTAPELGEALAALGGLPIEYDLGYRELRTTGYDFIVISPGVSMDSDGIAEASHCGVPIIGEMELALRLIDRPVVAVTGTNGKSTTTVLIGHLLESSGVKACVAGNIGTPLISVVKDAASAEVVVLEVSSFQIETTPSLKPHIAILLNATPDHLDRHKTFGAYVECKARLFAGVPKDGWGIYNVADEAVAQAVVSSGCPLIPFDATGRILKETRGKLGGEGPWGAGRAWFGGGDLWVHIKGGTRSHYPLEGVSLTGIHNRENMLSALVACELCGALPEILASGLKTFEGLPHRMQFVGEIRGVRYYDDSKGTNVGATIRALEGCAEPVVLIAGGLSKGVDFEALARAATSRVRKAILIGAAAAELERSFADYVETERADSMDDAVRRAHAAASPGDVVLLSPACASFDMFRDYKDRGEKFVDAVRQLTNGGHGGQI